VYANESADKASRVFRKTYLREGIAGDDLVLHSDNGSPMKGATMLATLHKLGVIPSFSRPSVSNDNPYSESLFRTMKYRPEYPLKPFEKLDQAQAWVDGFVFWYNTQHLHSAIRYVTPDDRHFGREQAILANRRKVYEKAREQLKRSEIKYTDKQFAFSRIMTCGRCGSGVSAEDKYKKLASGNVAHYVYYGCNRSRNIQCKEGYLREEEVIRQLIAIIGELEIDEGIIKKKFNEEYKRMAKFQKAFLNVHDNGSLEKDFDAKQYASHVLNTGTIEEKRELLGCVKNKLILNQKVISIQN